MGAVGQEQRLAIGDDTLAVDLHVGKGARACAGREDDLLGLQRAVELLPADAGRILHRAHLHLGGRAQFRRALVDIDLVLAHQELDALHQAVAHLAAALLRDRIVDGQVLEAEAEFLAVVQQVQDLCVAQQRLGWDTTDVQADAAQELTVDDRNLLAQLRGPDRGHIAARPTADDDDVVFSGLSHGTAYSFQEQRETKTVL